LPIKDARTHTHGNEEVPKYLSLIIAFVCVYLRRGGVVGAQDREKKYVHHSYSGRQSNRYKFL